MNSANQPIEREMKLFGHRGVHRGSATLFKRPPCPRPGFTLVEMLMVIVIISVLLFMFLPNAAKSKSTAEVQSMMMKASELNMAKASYAQAVGRTVADTNFADNGGSFVLTQ